MRTIKDYKQLNIKDFVFLISSAKDIIRYNGHKIQFTTTSPNYGGVRYWFVCPVCDKRKGTLYVVRSVMACRECAKLQYSLQDNKVNRDPFYKLMHYDRIVMKAKRELNPQQELLVCSVLLCGELGGFMPDKPKGMHWNTYVHKAAYIDSLTNKMYNLVKVMIIGRQKQAYEMDQHYATVLSEQGNKKFIG
ncbi:hypothetical protein AB3K25_04265 [Leuconostoc sp. MS02]|uniref:Uncharacterized protein n=1 Tax=Leuconostoc aquikimchii TaxID=3236804 RepID=A0ABV3S388_9LACO